MRTSSLSERQFEIIEAAGKLLSASGVGSLTIKNLAQAMHFSESAIYRHFSSKEEIILSMLDYLAQNMDERLEQVVFLNEHPLHQLEKMFMNQFTFFAEHPHFLVAVFSDGLMESSERINEAILRIMQVKMKHLMPIIMLGMEQGFLNNTIAPQHLVQIIMGTFRLQMFKWRVANFEFDIQSEGKEVMAALFQLIRT